MKYLAIVALGIFSAMSYGIVHDQITARICVEYFTIGHPNLFGTENPTLLRLGWGIVATWWVGLILGVPLAFASQFGKRPKRSVISLFRPIGILLLIMACGATVAGCVGYCVANLHLVVLTEPLHSEVLMDKYTAFLTICGSIWGCYSIGYLSGSVLCWKVWRSRKQGRPEIDIASALYMTKYEHGRLARRIISLMPPRFLTSCSSVLFKASETN